MEIPNLETARARKIFADYYRHGLLYIEQIEEKDIDYSIRIMLSNAERYPIDDLEWRSYSKSSYYFALKRTIEDIIDEEVESIK